VRRPSASERRRARLRAAAVGVHDAIDPLAPLPEPAEAPGVDDESHAPGHGHVPLPASTPDAESVLSRPRRLRWWRVRRF
jgi:hypothetical protein